MATHLTSQAAFPPSDAPLWTPTPERKASALITRFEAWLEQERGLRFASYEALWQWSVDDLERFWSAVLAFFELPLRTPCSRILSSDQMPGARWFEGARLNLVDQVFRHVDVASPAIVFESEAAGTGSMSWVELQRQVASVAQVLRDLGVQQGDRVVGYLPNIPQAVVAFLAAASLGAVWSLCSPEMGPVSVSDRFCQVEPKVLVAVDGYRFGGKPFDAAHWTRFCASYPQSAASSGFRILMWLRIHPSCQGSVRRCDGRTPSRANRLGHRRPSRQTTRSGSSTRRERQGCPRRSSTAMAGCSRTSW